MSQNNKSKEKHDLRRGGFLARVAGARLRLHRVLVDIDDVENPEDELPTPKSLEERSV